MPTYLYLQDYFYSHFSGRPVQFIMLMINSWRHCSLLIFKISKYRLDLLLLKKKEMKARHCLFNDWCSPNIIWNDIDLTNRLSFKKFLLNAHFYISYFKIRWITVSRGERIMWRNKQFEERQYAQSFDQDTSTIPDRAHIDEQCLMYNFTQKALVDSCYSLPTLSKCTWRCDYFPSEGLSWVSWSEGAHILEY